MPPGGPRSRVNRMARIPFPLAGPALLVLGCLVLARPAAAQVERCLAERDAPCLLGEALAAAAAAPAAQDRATALSRLAEMARDAGRAGTAPQGPGGAPPAA